MADRPAQSLAGGNATGAIRRGPASHPEASGGPAFADCIAGLRVSSYPAWVHRNLLRPVPPGLHLARRRGTERR
jgi:hypothetical protein